MTRGRRVPSCRPAKECASGMPRLLRNTSWKVKIVTPSTDTPDGLEPMHRTSSETTAGGAVAAVVLIGLYWTSRYSYLLFHSLAEMFSIVVSLGIFAFAWNTRRLNRVDFLVFLGIACLFCGFVDLLHTLSYKGMGVFRGFDANLPTQLWIAGRGLLSVSFLLAPFFIRHKLRYSLAIICYTTIVLVFIYTIFYLKVFPDCFIEGEGLTRFKKISEYIIVMIFIMAIVHFIMNGHEMEPYVLKSIVWSIVFMIVSELSFTLYIDVYGIANAVGHICKIIGFYLLYKGIIETGLTRPFDLLFVDLKRKQRELQESEVRYRTLFENSHSIMLLIHPQTGTIVEANPRACSFYGYTHRDLVGRNIAEFNTLPPEEIRREMERARTGSRTHFNFRHRLADGEIRDVEVHSGVVSIEGEPVLCSIIHDSTERRRAERLLRESESKYRTIFETTGTAMMIVDENAGISLVNAEFVRLFGYFREEVVGRMNLREFVPGEDWPIIERRHRIRRVSPDAVPRSYETRFLNKEGRIKDVVVTVALEPGTLRSVVSLLDITDRKRMAEELLKARKLESVAILAGGIAHDFNNLLGIILGYANLATIQLSPEHPAAFPVKQVENASIQARDLVEKFIFLAAQREPARERASLPGILTGEARSVVSPGVKTEFDFQPGLWEVEVDRAQIGQAIHNVIVNACEAMPNGGVLVIGARNLETSDDDEERWPPLGNGRYVEITVRDTGLGIPENDVQKVFDPYFSTKRRGNIKGMGLGLAMVHSIVSRHGGIIYVESEEGAGTAVHMRLPAAAPELLSTFEVPTE